MGRFRRAVPLGAASLLTLLLAITILLAFMATAAFAVGR